MCGGGGGGGGGGRGMLSDCFLVMYERETDSVSCANKCEVCFVILPVRQITTTLAREMYASEIFYV